MMDALPGSLGFRPIGPRDDEFLYRVYASTRQEELAVTGWADAEKEAFLRRQHQAQHSHYQAYFPGASFDLVLAGSESVGRLYVERKADEIRIIDIALLPRYRGQGVGSRLLGKLLDEAREAGLPVRIHVERNNPAMTLYDRLGFVPVEDQGVYLLMEWRPSDRDLPDPG